MTSAAEQSSGDWGGSSFNKYWLFRWSWMMNPGVTPSLFAPTIVQGPSELGGVELPGPCCSSAIDMRCDQCRLVYQALSGTSPSVLALSAPFRSRLLALRSRPGVTYVFSRKS